MNVEVLRARVEKRRKEWKRSDDGYVPDHTWDWLEAEGFIEDALGMDFDQQGVDFLVAKLTKCMRPYCMTALDAQPGKWRISETA
jgi:hypothetical protein